MWKRNLKKNTYAFNQPSIIIAGNGEIDVKFYDGKFNAYQRTYVLSPTKYFYLFLKECEFQISNLKSNSQGSVIKFITKSMLEEIVINVYKDSYETNNQLLTSYQYLINLDKRINILNKIKDLLLKKYFK